MLSTFIEVLNEDCSRIGLRNLAKYVCSSYRDEEEKTTFLSMLGFMLQKEKSPANCLDDKLNLFIESSEHFFSKQMHVKTYSIKVILC